MVVEVLDFQPREITPEDRRVEYVARSMALSDGVQPEARLIPYNHPLIKSARGHVISDYCTQPAWTAYASQARAAIAAITEYDADQKTIPGVTHG